MKSRNGLLGSAWLMLLCAADPAAAAITGIVNGSFEETTTPVWDYWDPGTYAAATSWIRLGAADAAGSLLSGYESISSSKGARLLRLVADNPSAPGRVAQRLGTMVTGQTYTFEADVMASSDAGSYGAKVAFVSTAAAVPDTVYNDQTVSLATGESGAFNFSYTAMPGDNGHDLFIWLEAVTQGSGSSSGGIDHARLTGLPPIAPAGPSPGTGTLATTSSLTWESTPGAISYQVFLWLDGATEPTEPTSEVLTPTWSPGPLAGTTYHWRVVAVNDYGSIPGAEWTFTTGVIPYTYVYAADSIKPAEPELTTPQILNDALIDAPVPYHSTTQATRKPAITLDLSAHDSLGKLTVWYSREVEAGTGAPDSVTVSDEFSHSATTVFSPPSANGISSQEVALTEMLGTKLHLSFTGTLETVALIEIRVFSQMPLPPAIPQGPRPTHGNVTASISTRLEWNPSVGATSYDVFLWCPPQDQPLTPTASGVTTNHWTPSELGASDATYSWQVVARNAYGSAEGAVWSFATSISPFTYSYDDLSAKPENYGGGYGETRANPHLLNDGQPGGWGGSGLALYNGPDYLNHDPAAFWPAITLTLTHAPGSYEALRIWHYGGNHDLGVYGPSSLTVTDDYGNSTTFDSFPDADTSTDVPIPAMHGTTLHLRFSSRGPMTLIGLSEIKVLGTPGYDAWAQIHADSQPPSGDADHDGVSNGIEYFMGAPDGFTANPEVVDGKVTWPRDQPAPPFKVQVSDNLGIWTDILPDDPDLSITPSQVSYTLPLNAGKKFCRLAVTP